MCYSIAQSIESLFFLALQYDLFDIAAFGISLESLLDAAAIESGLGYFMDKS